MSARGWSHLVPRPGAATGARSSYGYKQLLYEPFFGGGLITALSIPIVVQVGLIPASLASTALILLTITIGIRLRRSVS